MLYLVIEASTERGCLVIFENEQPLFQAKIPFGMQSSSVLLPELIKGLYYIEKQPKDIQFIAVGVGPGSYTGLRVGAIIAKSFAYALKIPLISLCTLKCFVPQCEGSFAVLIDAKISGAYWLKGTKNAGEYQFHNNPTVSSLESLQTSLLDVELIASPSIQHLRSKFEALGLAKKGGWQEVEPNLGFISKLAMEKFQKKQFLQDSELELSYLRKTQAEIERNK